MLQQCLPNERKVRSYEDMLQSKGRRLSKVGGKMKLVPIKDLVGNGLWAAKRARDAHVEDLRHAIDYHLTTLAYEDVPCSECRLPLAALEFAEALPSFEPPAIQCKTCLGRTVVRAKRKDEQSIADAKRVKYFSSVLDDWLRCCKIKVGTSDADRAYEELEAANRSLLVKFGNEKQTSLEGPDAEQGVRQGIVDAAIRFDPTRKEGASFNTVAYNWCRRNSRARHTGQKRAGVYAPSIEGFGASDPDAGVGWAAMVTSSHGALGTFSPATTTSPELILDLREKVAALPELEQGVVAGEMAGLSTSQIAEQMNITKAKVRKLRKAAFETLRESLAGYVSALRD
jgi:DNA-directed RNA polymerase specialized sigma24 family protein